MQSFSHSDLAPNIDTFLWTIADIRKTSVETFWLQGGVDIFSHESKIKHDKDDNTFKNQTIFRYEIRDIEGDEKAESACPKTRACQTN